MRKISQQRLLAFTKRLCVLCLQILHNGALGCLTIIKSILQVSISIYLKLYFKDNFIKDLVRLLCIYYISEGFVPSGVEPER